MVGVNIYFSRQNVPEFRFMLLVANQGDALRMGREHVNKDSNISSLKQKHVVNVSDPEEWRAQRAHIIDAFLPNQTLARSVPVLAGMADTMVSNWHAELQATELGTLDVKAWMHHTALAMFVRVMMGDDRAFTPAAATAAAAAADAADGDGDGDDDDDDDGYDEDFESGENDLCFAASSPKDSAKARALFNLEQTGIVQTKEAQLARVGGMIGYGNKLFARAEERRSVGEPVGRLIDRLSVLEDRGVMSVKMQNMFAVLVAGHDTTAYTMQYLLMQLARDQPLQDRVRSEASAVFADLARERRGLAFGDLPRFKLLTKCIAETLRLWNVASVVFPRVTSSAEKATGLEQEQDQEREIQVDLPTGTKFTFCKWVADSATLHIASQRCITAFVHECPNLESRLSSASSPAPMDLF